MIDRYSAYQVFPDLNVNGQLTLGENIGDLSGLSIAHVAYRRYVDEHHDGEAPVIDGISGDQRFFLAWGQLWRSKYADGFLRQIVVADPHSPGEFRVNGTVPMLDAWYDAFDVKEGDALYVPPVERVRIW